MVIPIPRIDNTQPPTEPRIIEIAGNTWCHITFNINENDQSGAIPVEYACPSGNNFNLNAKKKSKKIANNTGGTPVNMINGVAIARNHPGDRGQAAIAPSKLPIINDKIADTNNNDIVHGNDS